MGLDEVTDLMFDLEVNALTSNEEDYQCLVSPNCQKPHLESCKDCPFAVPNFYSLSSLIEGFKTSIFEFVRDFDPNTFEGEKNTPYERIIQGFRPFTSCYSEVWGRGSISFLRKRKRRI